MSQVGAARARRQWTLTSVFLAVGLGVAGLGVLHFFLLGALSPWPYWDNPYNLASYTERAWCLQVIIPGLMGLSITGALVFAAMKLRSIGLAALGIWVFVSHCVGVAGMMFVQHTLKPAWDMLANGRYLAESVLGAAVSLADMLVLVVAGYLLARDLATRASAAAPDG